MKSFAKENIIKDIRNLCRLNRKELNYIATKDIINLFTLGKETKAIKDRIRIFLSMKKKIIRNQ